MSNYQPPCLHWTPYFRHVLLHSGWCTWAGQLTYCLKAEDIHCSVGRAGPWHVKGLCLQMLSFYGIGWSMICALTWDFYTSVYGTDQVAAVSIIIDPREPLYSDSFMTNWPTTSLYVLQWMGGLVLKLLLFYKVAQTSQWIKISTLWTCAEHWMLGHVPTHPLGSVTFSTGTPRNRPVSHKF